MIERCGRRKHAVKLWQHLRQSREAIRGAALSAPAPLVDRGIDNGRRRTLSTSGKSAAEGFTKGAESYDQAVRHNISGSDRLVMSLPEGEYRTVLDVGSHGSEVQPGPYRGCRPV